MPVGRRPIAVLVPRRSLQQCCAVRQRLQFKLPALRDEVIVQMRRVEVAINRQLLHRGWLAANTKRQQTWFIPNRNRLDECPRRKDTVPLGANSMTMHLGANRIRDTSLEHCFSRWRQL